MFKYIMNKLGYYKLAEMKVPVVREIIDNRTYNVDTIKVNYRLSRYEKESSYGYNVKDMITSRLHDELLNKIKTSGILDISKETVDYNGDTVYSLEMNIVNKKGRI